MDLGRTFDHTDHGQMDASLADVRGHSEPAVHKEILGPDSGSESLFEHRLYQIRELADCLFALFRPAGSGVDLFCGVPIAVFLHGERQQGEVHRGEGGSVGPAQAEESEAFEKATLGMVENLCEKLYFFCSRSVYCRIIEDQHCFAIL